MSYFEALLYGLIQGLTEYLPISSSAHLILLPRFLGEKDPGLAFDVFLHLGTLFATLAYFWRDWLGVLDTVPGLPASVKDFCKTYALDHGRPLSPDLVRVQWQWIVIATVPALFAGALFHHTAETVFRGVYVIMCTQVIGGVLLYVSDHFFRRDRALGTLGNKGALWIGVIQCLALIPGMSRSGMTIVAGRVIGLDRVAAARFSFLISGPVTLAAIVFELRKWPELLSGPVGALPLLIAGVASFVFGLIAIGGLLKLVRNFGYLSFAIYRVALAIVIYGFLIS